MNNQRIAIDTEGNGGDVRDGRGYAYGVSLAFRHQGGTCAFYLPFRHSNSGRVGNYDLVRFLPYLQEIINRNISIYHNAKYDLVALATLGLDTKGTEFLDTMILCHLVDENQPYAGKGLDACVKFYTQHEGKKKSDTFTKGLKIVGWAGMTPEMHGEYAAWDAYVTLELFDAILPKLKAENLLPMWQHKKKFTELLISMENRGVRVNVDLCEEMTKIGEARMVEIRDELGLNPGSVKDLKVLLIDQLGLPTVRHMKTDRPTFDKQAMEEYEEILELLDNTTARLILEYRGWQKSVSSNYLPYVHLLSPDGRLRPNYKMHGTKTGRLSCATPNLQQIPRSGQKAWNGKMKDCFIPDEGYELWECDYSQLEFRLNAAYGEQQNLIEIFADPTRDVFDEMAEELDWPRFQTKTFVYSTAYGAGARRISNVFGVDQVEARRRIDHFYELYPGLRRASRIASSMAIRNGKVPLWSGRYRHFLYPESDSHKALNSIVQGGAADIVEERMIALADGGMNDGDKCRMLLQVHDSVVFEIRSDCVAEKSSEIQRIMSNVRKEFGVVFRTDLKRWGS
jgi:DNA polymerase-1